MGEKRGYSPTALGVQIPPPGRPCKWAGVSACEGDSHLAGVLASLEEASTDHVFGDLSWVRFFTLVLAQQRGIQALQQLGVVGFGDQGKKKCGSGQL